jgi:NADH:ubiquinone oxidoreductase subunit 6 (subunit J)
MMLQLEAAGKAPRAWARQWLPALLLGAVALAVTVLVLLTAPGGDLGLTAALATPRQFGRVLFKQYWLPVEIVSFLLLVALVGALYLGRRERGGA